MNPGTELEIKKSVNTILMCAVELLLPGTSGMHLTLNLGTLHIRQAFLSFSYDFMFDRIICVLVNI